MMWVTHLKVVSFWRAHLDQDDLTLFGYFRMMYGSNFMRKFLTELAVVFQRNLLHQRKN